MASSSFSTKECEGAVFTKNTGVEILKMHYQYTDIESVWSSITGT